MDPYKTLKPKPYRVNPHRGQLRQSEHPGAVLAGGGSFRGISGVLLYP